MTSGIEPANLWLVAYCLNQLRYRKPTRRFVGICCLHLQGRREQRKQHEGVNELQVGKDLEGSGCGLIEVLSQDLSQGTEETH
jgi:hypothetical protein